MEPGGRSIEAIDPIIDLGGSPDSRVCGKASGRADEQLGQSPD